MATEIKIPNVGESITSANVAVWHKQDGEAVSKGDTVLTIETDKVSNDLTADADGTLRIHVQEGEEVAIGTVVAVIEDASAAPAAASTPAEPESPAASEPVAPAEPVRAETESKVIEIKVPAAGESITSANVGNWHVANGAQVSKGDVLVTLETDKISNELDADADGKIDIIVAEGEEVGIGTVIATLTTGAAAEKKPEPVTPIPAAETKQPVAQASQPVPVTPQPSQPSAAASPSSEMKPDLNVVPGAPERAGSPEVEADGRTTRRKMSMMRRKIASHLVNAQQTAAILTTFNEVDMTAIMDLRKLVQENFISKYGCKLGFMSFFIKATVEALMDVSAINASIDGTDIIQNNFYDIGVAIGTEKGLVVPVLRDCDKKSFAEIEQGIIDYAEKARDGKIQLDDLQGGVFTISNGGVYGSLLSTPILSPPQSGILGMHTIQQRPVAINGEVVIRPMMNLALSYDHRLVDGKEAVTFLIRIKESLENPSRLMLGM
ncbi:MAG: dihydrolipoyllysine-residue succinyltransferase [Akkermansiaceae bacterium]